MTVCNTKETEFSSCKSRKVEAQFCGEEIASDGGVRNDVVTDLAYRLRYAHHGDLLAVRLGN